MAAKMIVTYRKQNRKLENIRRHRRRHYYSQGEYGRSQHLFTCPDCLNWRRNKVENEG